MNAADFQGPIPGRRVSKTQSRRVVFVTAPCYLIVVLFGFSTVWAARVGG